VNDLLAFNPTSTTIALSWTTTGDDGNNGTPTALEIFRSACPFNLGGATPVSGEPAPIARTLQQMTVGGLSPSTTYCFAMRVLDELGTPSPLSNVASATTDAPDVTAPGTVTNLRGSAPFTVDLLTAPAIAASSAASGSTGFANATDGNLSSYWGSVGTPTLTVQTITLDTGSSHNIGQVRLRSRGSGALFPEDLEIQVSNDNVIFTTVHAEIGLPSTPGIWHDLAFPAASGRYVRVRATKPRTTPGGLFYTHIAEIEVYEATFFFGPVTLRWTAPGDDGPNGTATVYDVRFSTSPILNIAVFNGLGPANQASGEPSPHAAGFQESFDVNLPPGTYFFAIVTRDEANNASALSNVPLIAVP
jgi:F5/8 type C domain